MVLENSESVGYTQDVVDRVSEVAIELLALEKVPADVDRLGVVHDLEEDTLNRVDGQGSADLDAYPLHFDD